MTEPREQPERSDDAASLAGVPLDDAIEACQPDGREWLEAELAPLARQISEVPERVEQLRRTQALDRALVAAFRDAPEPAGLRERVLAALAAAPAQTSAPAQPSVEVAPRRGRTPRRAVLAALATSAALLLAAGWWWFRAPSSYSADSIADHAQSVLADAATADFQPGPPPGWQSPATLAGASIESWAPVRYMERNAKLVRLTRNGVRATLIVAPWRGGPAIEGSLPSEIYTTGKHAIGVLRDRKQLYVLAVEGDKRDYQRFLESGAVALRQWPKRSAAV